MLAPRSYDIQIALSIFNDCLRENGYPDVDGGRRIAATVLGILTGDLFRLFTAKVTRQQSIIDRCDSSDGSTALGDRPTSDNQRRRRHCHDDSKWRIFGIGVALGRAIFFLCTFYLTV